MLALLIPGVGMGGGPDGFIPPTPPPTTQNAGSKRRSKRRYLVEIDGQTFEAESEQHAIAILDRAVSLAPEAAAKQIAPLIKRAKRKGKIVPVELKAPVIEALGVDPASWQQKIDEIYAKAALEAEMRALLSKKLAEEDEDDDLSILMMD